MISAATAALQMRELLERVAEAPVRPTPNPRVGCRIVDEDGSVLGEGIHGKDGLHHAEVIALAQAGTKAKGAHAIVTLEPCAHTGKTPPCVEALIVAGVSSVWYSISDPTIGAGGAEVLRAAGIHVTGGVETEAGLSVLESWLHFHNTGKPFVVLKMAATLDGFAAAKDGSSRWITSEPARTFVHRLRSQSDAVLVGTGTVLADDPRLDVRLEGEWPQPRVFVLGEREIPQTAAIAGRFTALQHRDLPQALNEIAATGCHQVLVEGGPTVAAELLKAGLVDRLLWMVAPKLLGAGIPAVGDLGISQISGAQEWRLASVRTLYPDLALELRPNSDSD